MKKTAHSVAMRFKDSEQKYCGDLGQCSQDLLDDYDQIAENYNLYEEQQLIYLHNLLPKDAHPYYLEKVKPNVETYAEALELIKKIKFGSAPGSRQKPSQ